MASPKTVPIHSRCSRRASRSSPWIRSAMWRRSWSPPYAAASGLCWSVIWSVVLLVAQEVGAAGAVHQVGREPRGDVLVLGDIGHMAEDVARMAGARRNPHPLVPVPVDLCQGLGREGDA